MAEVEARPCRAEGRSAAPPPLEQRRAKRAVTHLAPQAALVGSTIVKDNKLQPPVVSSTLTRSV